MTKEQWVDSFKKSLIELEDESYVDSDAEWTEFMMKVMRKMGQEIGCHIAGKNSEVKKYSGEYLNIDAMFIDNSAYDDWLYPEDWDPPVLPSAVVELENQYDIKWITYCLWKILCIRAEMRVLICYQSNTEKVESLRKYLEETIRNRNLMKDVKGELLVIIGNSSQENSPWKDYFNIFDWQNEHLDKIEVFI